VDAGLSDQRSGNSLSEQRGQGVFRANVLLRELLREEFCRVTCVNEPRHLKASHIKPWRDATDTERLDGANGLLLSPHIDHLFDAGYITFSSGQKLVIGPEVRNKLLDAWASMPACAWASSPENRMPIRTTTRQCLQAFAP
jgi:predicted restriction endonuclease